MSKAKKPAAEELAYNKNLRAEIETDVNNSPRARVHQVEWRKIMVMNLQMSAMLLTWKQAQFSVPPYVLADRRACRDQPLNRTWL